MQGLLRQPLSLPLTEGLLVKEPLIKKPLTEELLVKEPLREEPRENTGRQNADSRGTKK